MNFNFDNHIHTVYSGHSDPDMTVRNIIEMSESIGLEQISITEHSFDWHLGPRGNMELIKQELAGIDSGVHISIGMEIDPDMENPGRLHFEDFDRAELFPVLVGFHGFPLVAKGWFEKVEFSQQYKNRIYKRWFEMMEKLIQNPMVDILAHPGRIIMQNGIIEEFAGAVLKDFERLAAAAKQYNVAFEVNETLLGRIPTERLAESYKNVLAVMLEHGVKLSAGSDAHELDKIGRFDKILEFIEPFNIDISDFLTIKHGEGNEK